MHRAKTKAQSTLEYAVVIAVVVAALLAIQVYMKRSVQGKLRSSTDNIGEQYSAGITTVTKTTTQTGDQVADEATGTEELGKGTSIYHISYPAKTTTTAKDKTEKKLNEENLF